mgnify:FL=1
MPQNRFLISNLTEEQIDIIFEMMDHFNGDKNANKIAKKCLSNIIKYDHTDYNKLANDVKGVRV